MIYFFGNQNSKVYAVQSQQEFSQETKDKLTWLLASSELVSEGNNTPLASLNAFFIGPRAAMITPWSTNAVEITQNMGISGIIRIEEFTACSENFSDYDPMISEKFNGLSYWSLSP